MRPIGRTVSPSLLCVLAAGTAVFGGGCVDLADPPVVASIAIAPWPPTEFLLEDAGRTVQLAAIAKDRNGQVIPDPEVVWSSSDTNIVQVSDDGLVTAIEPGKTTVRAAVGTLEAATSVRVAQGQRAVLQKFYRRTGGIGWSRAPGWRTDAPIHLWYGVRIDTLGYITGLWLPYNGLTGAMPPEMGVLGSLELLWLSGNRMTGPIPPELGELQNLERLAT